MSKKNSIRSLSDSSLAELATLLVSTLSFSEVSYDVNNISIVMVEINKYLEKVGASWYVYQDLLRVILSSDYLPANMRFMCLQMLLNGNVTFLVTEVFPFSFYEKILQIIAAQGTGLRVLNLKGIWVKEEHMHYTYEIVKKCDKLTKLYVPYIANDELLEAIAKHCKNLEILDISGETDITEIGIDYLSTGESFQHLTVVNIGMPGEENICYSDIALLLKRCPNIETFATYSFVGAALKFIHDKVDNNFCCKLKYLHDINTDGDTLNVIVKTCPRLESIYLDSPKAGSLHILRTLRINKLKIYKFDCSEFLDLMNDIGWNLSHLTMIKGNGYIDLSKLSVVCPSLVDLDCYMMMGMSFTNYRSKFQQLEGLEMLSSSMSTLDLKTFICNSTTLKRLAVDKVTFTDEDIVSIFIEHDFNILEDIWFTTAPHLTVHAVEILMERCPELQSVGQLSGWSLNTDELILIRCLLKSGNSSLVLILNGFMHQIFPMIIPFHLKISFNCLNDLI